MQQQR
jgi:hypothetical protein